MGGVSLSPLYLGCRVSFVVAYLSLGRNDMVVFQNTFGLTRAPMRGLGLGARAVGRRAARFSSLLLLRRPQLLVALDWYSQRLWNLLSARDRSHCSYLARLWPPPDFATAFALVSACSTGYSPCRRDRSCEVRLYRAYKGGRHVGTTDDQSCEDVSLRVLARSGPQTLTAGDDKR